MTFHDCCMAIVKNREAKALNYAVGYARAGLSMDEPREQKTQALYILNNITAWRGKEAKAVRAALKQIGGVK